MFCSCTILWEVQKNRHGWGKHDSWYEMWQAIATSARACHWCTHSFFPFFWLACNACMLGCSFTKALVLQFKLCTVKSPARFSTTPCSILSLRMLFFFWGGRKFARCSKFGHRKRNNKISDEQGEVECPANFAGSMAAICRVAKASIQTREIEPQSVNFKLNWNFNRLHTSVLGWKGFNVSGIQVGKKTWKKSDAYAPLQPGNLKG